jgi:hypothetical protein
MLQSDPESVHFADKEFVVVVELDSRWIRKFSAFDQLSVHEQIKVIV